MEKCVSNVWNIRDSADQLSLDLSIVNMFYRIAKQSFSE